jgi:hypothetical protein
MFRKTTASALALAIAAAGSGPAWAHHSSAMYDLTKQIEVTGEVVEFQYTNPHSWLIIAVKNDDGTVTNWGFEVDGPSALQRAGIGKNTFPPGTHITVRGRPLKDGRPGAAWMDATMPDGTVISPPPPGG